MVVASGIYLYIAGSDPWILARDFSVLKHLALVITTPCSHVEEPGGWNPGRNAISFIQCLKCTRKWGENIIYYLMGLPTLSCWMTADWFSKAPEETINTKSKGM